MGTCQVGSCTPGESGWLPAEGDGKAAPHSTFPQILALVFHLGCFSPISSPSEQAPPLRASFSQPGASSSSLIHGNAPSSSSSPVLLSSPPSPMILCFPISANLSSTYLASAPPRRRHFFIGQSGIIWEARFTNVIFGNLRVY